MTLKIKNGQLVDGDGRVVFLRGVCLSANCKYPARPFSPTHVKTDFSDHRSVSFIGHPFPLNEASEHLKRLKHWGFNAIRLLVTWEAIEHEGPGIYDKEYLDYISELVKIIENEGFYILIDPHQDVWARMSGGDGAPGWTFEKVGLDFTKFDECDAALVMQHRYDPGDPSTFKDMEWSGNAYRFASSTMWTLFFAGEDLAPSFKIDGKSAQEYFQDHFINAMKQIASCIKDNKNVIGFLDLSESPLGWIELLVDGSNNKNLGETLGHSFSPIDAMATASGLSRVIGYREIKKFGIKETRKDELNKGHVSCWLLGHEDIWRQEGIWDVDQDGEPRILKNDHFTVHDGKQIDYYRDYLSGYISRFMKGIKEEMKDALFFIDVPYEKLFKGEKIEISIDGDFENLVFAPSWYDVATLGTKKPMLKASFDMMADKPLLGKGSIAKAFTKQIFMLKGSSSLLKQGIPTVIKEFGLPFNLNKGAAYEKFKTEGEGAWDKHVECMTLYYDAIDHNLLSSFQWNYTPNNFNELGDQWNLEDLSIFSVSQRIDPTDINSGGRGIKGFSRPFCVKCAGIPREMEFDAEQREFHFEWKGDASIKSPTIIFVPRIQFPLGFEIEIDGGTVEEKEDEQLVSITLDSNDIIKIRIIGRREE
ncbi:MAG: cellulase family glycosylhydrolase [Candidatus Hodarchaeota archaeon]